MPTNTTIGTEIPRVMLITIKILSYRMVHYRVIISILLSILKGVRKIAQMTISFAMSVRLYVSPIGTTRLPLGRFHEN